MRYRPFGQTGSAVSAVSLALTDMRGWDTRDWTAPPTSPVSGS